MHRQGEQRLALLRQTIVLIVGRGEAVQLMADAQGTSNREAAIL